MKHELTSRRKERRIMAVWTSLVLTTALFTTSAFAADSDPLTIVNNLSDFIFSCIKAIGIIILGWGVVQLGMSVQSHDATQRTQGVLCLFGGLLIAFAKEILTAIGVVYAKEMRPDLGRISVKLYFLICSDLLPVFRKSHKPKQIRTG